LELLASPRLVVPSADASLAAQRRSEELRALALDGVHQGSARHYRGSFAAWHRVASTEPTRVAWLTACRTALTGIHLAGTGEVEARLPRLVEVVERPALEGWLARPAADTEGAAALEALAAEA